MIIEKGFNNEPTEIKIHVSDTGEYLPTKDKKIEIYIYQEGLIDKETLAYMTVGELLDLRDEVEIALKVSLGLEDK